MTDNQQPPLSPHLQIYKLPLTALVSITHRACGVVLSLAAVLLVALLAAAAAGPESYAALHQHIDSWYGHLLLIGLTFALFFHLCNGIRHLFWDIGWGFDLDKVDQTAKMVIGIALALTAITWLIALF